MVEKFTFFIEGALTMLLFVTGVYLLLTNTKGLKKQTMFGAMNLQLAFLNLLEILFVFDVFKDSLYIRILIYCINFTLYPMAMFVILEFLSSGWITRKRLVWIMTPFFVFILAFAFTNIKELFFAYYGFSIIFSLCALGLISFYVIKRDAYNRSLIKTKLLFFVTCMFAFMVFNYSLFIFNRNPYVDLIYYTLFVIMWAFVIYYIRKQISLN